MQITMKILKQQILQSGVEKSTSCQEDSRVNLSPSQGEERERKTTAISGRKCYGQYRRSNPIGLLVRTLLESSRWYSPARRLNWVVQRLFSERITRTRRFNSNMSLRPCAKTLNTQDTLSSRYLFRLVPSERRTVGTGFGLLPTVQTQGLKVCNKQGKTVFMPLDLLPTPVASDGQGGAAKVTGKKIRRASGQVYSAKLRDLSVSNLLPTPRANKVNGINLNNPQIAQRNKGNLEESVAKIIQAIPYEDGKTSQLNPLFVAEMMGFPLMWTTLPYLSRSGERNQSRPTETP